MNANLLKVPDAIKIIPMNWCPTRFFSFYFKGWKKGVITMETDELLDSIEVAEASLLAFYSIYKEKFAFTEPILGVEKDYTIFVKIGMMELELYEKMEKINEHPSP